MKLTKKIIRLEDGEVGIQFEPEELEKLGWKEGDEFEWIPTKEEINELVTFGRDSDGKLQIGDVKGSVWGSVEGSVEGNVYGNVEGSVKGDVWGDVEGNVATNG